MADIPHFTVLPRHIGIIMDGNGRWAKMRGLPRTEGHRKGAEVFRDITTYCCELGIEVVTFYAFSTENWRRPPEEVGVLMNLFRDFLAETQRREQENEKMGFRIRFIGDMNRLPEDIRSLAAVLEARSSSQTHTTVNVAVNYGGRQEIVRAARAFAEKVKAGELTPDEISEEDFSAEIYTAFQPDPDMIIRPGGEFRLSNFMTWQSAYSELYFTDVYWPDFTREELNKALTEFDRRSRRFRGI